MRNFLGDRQRCWRIVAGSGLQALSLLLRSWRQPATQTPAGIIATAVPARRAGPPAVHREAVRAAARAVPPVAATAPSVLLVDRRAVRRAAVTVQSVRRVDRPAVPPAAAGVAIMPIVGPCGPTATPATARRAVPTVARRVVPRAARRAARMEAVRADHPAVRRAVPTARTAATLHRPTPAATPRCRACRAACQSSRTG